MSGQALDRALSWRLGHPPPQGSSLLNELCCLGPSSRNRPHPPHPRAHRNFIAWRLTIIRNAFAVRGAPRRPAGGSGLSVSIPSWHAVLSDPGELDHRCGPELRYRRGLRREIRTARHSQSSRNPFHAGHAFRGFPVYTFATAYQVARPPVRIRPIGSVTEVPVARRAVGAYRGGRRRRRNRQEDGVCANASMIEAMRRDSHFQSLVARRTRFAWAFTVATLIFFSATSTS